jgi:hypothetical protein
MATNPQTLHWTDPTTFEDGSPFGASDFRAYELGTAAQETGTPVPVLVLPTNLGVGQSPIPDAVRSTRGLSYLFLRTLDNYGQNSAWSNAVEVRFTGRPLAPSGLSAV